MNDLDNRLRAWNPVRAEDAADSAAAATLLQHVLDQPITGHAQRRSTRHRLWALAGVTAVAAAAVLVAVVLQGPSAPRGTGNHHPAPGNPLANARLAAWTVAKQANGDIDVTIRQLKNPAGLQSTLRADGLPVRVSYSRPRPPIRVDTHRGHPAYMFTDGVRPGYHGPAGQAPKLPCKFYPSRSLLNAVVHFPRPGTKPHGATVYLVLKPSALPTGAGLAMFLGGSLDDIIPPNSVPPGTDGAVGQSTLGMSKDGQPRVEYSVNVTPVYASQQCTG